MLKVSDLSVSYGKALVLDGLDMELDKGEMFSIIGPNGAGKTTLLRSINGLHRPNRGTINFEEQSIINQPAHKVATLGITHCPEGRRPFPEMTVKENLLMGGLNLSKQKLDESLDYVYELFPILKEREAQYAGTMSGGQQQMVAIARALMTSPKLLMLDEPSLGLAPLAVDEIFERISQIKKSGVTVLLVEQNVDVALNITDRIAVLDAGRITFVGQPDDLVKDTRLKEIYLGLA